MSAIDDLRKKVERLKSQLDAANDKYHAALKAAHPIQPGAILESKRGTSAEVTGLFVRYGEVHVEGRKILANGRRHKREGELHSFDEWKIKTPAPHK